MEASGKLQNIFNRVKIKFMNADKAAYREKFIVLIYLYERRIKVSNNLNFHLKETGKRNINPMQKKIIKSSNQ